MREVHLPGGASERELELAEQVALAMRSGVLIVCWTERHAVAAPLQDRRKPHPGL